MGVYIKGMKMPTKCEDCALCYGLGEEHVNFCRAQLEPNDAVEGGMMWKEIDHDKIDDGCPLVEVKEPHGRLIDADVAQDRLLNIMCGTGYQSRAISAVIYEYITPTVIESEE